MKSNGSQDLQFYISEFRSEECQCGRTKQTRRSFCYQCYASLPPVKQKALFQKFGQGYEQAYDDALLWLN